MKLCFGVYCISDILQAHRVMCHRQRTLFDKYDFYNNTIRNISTTIVMGLPLLKNLCSHGALTRYVKLRVAHAPGMLRTFSPPPQVSYPNMPWCMPVLLTSSFVWSRWRGKVPGIPSAYASRKFAYLVRGPLSADHYSLNRCSFWNQHH